MPTTNMETVKSDTGRIESKPQTATVSDAVILFDGVCNLCNSSVNFVIDRDRAGYFKFGALQTPEAEPFVAACGRDAGDEDDLLQSIVLVEKGRCYTKSTAALKIARRLNGAWPLLYGFMIVPRFFRDFVYDWIAANRYKWFGKQDACRLPTPELKQRFL